MSVPLDSIRPIRFENQQLILLDQRKLPSEEVYLTFTNVTSVATAIRDMVVRGAPAIGITAAYGIVLAAIKNIAVMEPAFEQLANARPTAVNLFWALNKMRDALNTSAQLTHHERIVRLIDCADKIFQEDISNNYILGKLGASLIEKNSQIYTHCNAGALATGGYGTALGVIRSAFTDNKITHVYAGETRPWLQGARLTAWELMHEGIPMSLVTEGAAGQLLRQGNIQWIIVGADRISANGDVANKVGTYNLAVLAKYHNVKVMVVAPTSTFDLNLSAGEEIEIEQRDLNEVTHVMSVPMTPKNCHAINPSFDITPHELIDAIVCEKGILTAPFCKNIHSLLIGGSH